MSNAKTGLEALRIPFAPNQISYLPKGGIRLAYVGHAALTDRLLDVDPSWSWEPLALGPNGLPTLDESGGLWIRLTVLGVTRLGYGDAGAKKGGDAMKERIGDALRNAAMRFGAALDLWHKGDLHADDSLVPVLEASIAVEKAKRTGVMADVIDGLPELAPEDKLYFDELAQNVKDLFLAKGSATAFDRIKAEQLDNEQSLHLWARLDSKIRTALKVEKGLRIGAA